MVFVIIYIGEERHGNIFVVGVVSDVYNYGNIFREKYIAAYMVGSFCDNVCGYCGGIGILAFYQPRSNDECGSNQLVLYFISVIIADSGFGGGQFMVVPPSIVAGIVRE